MQPYKYMQQVYVNVNVNWATEKLPNITVIHIAPRGHKKGALGSQGVLKKISPGFKFLQFCVKTNLNDTFQYNILK